MQRASLYTAEWNIVNVFLSTLAPPLEYYHCFIQFQNLGLITLLQMAFLPLWSCKKSQTKFGKTHPNPIQEAVKS